MRKLGQILWLFIVLASPWLHAENKTTPADHKLVEAIEQSVKAPVAPDRDLQKAPAQTPAAKDSSGMVPWWSTILGAMVGGLLSIFATLVNQWGTRKALERQLQDARQQRVDEREFQARKELYFASAEKVANALELLSRSVFLPYDTFTKELNQLGLSAATAKLGLFVTGETYEKVAGYMQAQTQVFLKIMLKKVPLEILRADIERKQNHFDTLIAFSKEPIDFSRFDENGVKKALQQSAELQKLIGETLNELSQMGSQHLQASNELFEECTREMEGLLDPLTDLQISIRLELGILTDRDALMAGAQRVKQFSRETMSNYMKSAKALANTI
jgi:hypothetical protein